MRTVHSVLFTLPLAFALSCAVSTAPTAQVSVAAGRTVIDTRAPEEFANGHTNGALNLQLGWDQLEERISAYVSDPSTPLAVRATDPAEARRALRILAERGFDDVTLLVADTEPRELLLCTAQQLSKQLGSPTPPTVIDVRSRAEYEQGTIPGALLFEQDEAPSRLDELDPAGHYAVICEGGYRSSQFASLMQQKGFEHVVNVIDGMAAWNRLER